MEVSESWKREDDRRRIVAVLLFVLPVSAFFLSMCVGRYSVPLSDVIAYFTGGEIGDIENVVLSDLRIPRTLAAILIGAALSVSGAIYQSIFNNKIVSPDLLGVSSGASLGACLAILLGLSMAAQNLIAFVFGFVTVIFTLLLSRLIDGRSNLTLLLSGIALGGLMSSGVGLMKYLADDEMKLSEMTFWLLGDLSATTMDHISILLPIVLICCAVAVLLAWNLNVVSLGRRESQSLGIDYRITMFIMIVIATLMTSASVSVSGTIGWVGLVIPNLIRIAFGSDNRMVIPASISVGAAFMVIVDCLARSLAPNEIPLSIITGILGTPLFVYVMYRKRREMAG